MGELQHCGLASSSSLGIAQERCVRSSALSVNVPRERQAPFHPLPWPCAKLRKSRRSTFPAAFSSRCSSRPPTPHRWTLSDRAFAIRVPQRGQSCDVPARGNVDTRSPEFQHVEELPALRWPGSGQACSCPSVPCCGSAALQPRRSRSTSQFGRRGDGVPAVPIPPAFPMPAQVPPSSCRGSSNLAGCATPHATSAGSRTACAAGPSCTT